MSQQTIKQQARRTAREMADTRRRERRERERHVVDLAEQVMVAIGQRDAAVAETEKRAGDALRELTEVKGLSLREAVEWCGETEKRAGDALRELTEVEGLSLGEAVEWCGETVTAREATQLRRLATSDDKRAGGACDDSGDECGALASARSGGSESRFVGRVSRPRGRRAGAPRPGRDAGREHSGALRAQQHAAVGHAGVRELPAARHLGAQGGSVHQPTRLRKSYSTAKQARTVLNLAFGLGVRYDGLRENPVRETARLHKPPSQTMALTLEQVDAIRAAVRSWPGRQVAVFDASDLLSTEFFDDLVVVEASADSDRGRSHLQVGLPAIGPEHDDPRHVSRQPACAGEQGRDLKTPIHAFVEAHIEQGPIMMESGVPVGNVTSIQGTRWYEIVATGQASHAGSTPRANRQDALRVATAIASHIYQEFDAGDDLLRMTIGRIEARPGSVNVVPEEVRMTLDIRHPEEGVLDGVEARLEGVVANFREHASLRRVMQMPPTHFDDKVWDAIRQSMADLGQDSMELSSGAFRDALYLAQHCPTGMIFVPSIDGLSHNPAEHTKHNDLVEGTRLLAATVVRLANG